LSKVKVDLGIENNDMQGEVIEELQRHRANGPIGRLERVRRQVQVLRKKFRTGWRAVEGAWVSAGNDVMSAFSRAIGAPPLPHSASVTHPDTVTATLQSPLYTCKIFCCKKVYVVLYIFSFQK
jgi:hypothetical protein